VPLAVEGHTEGQCNWQQTGTVQYTPLKAVLVVPPSLRGNAAQGRDVLSGWAHLNPALCIAAPDDPLSSPAPGAGPARYLLARSLHPSPRSRTLEGASSKRGKRKRQESMQAAWGE